MCKIVYMQVRSLQYYHNGRQPADNLLLSIASEQATYKRNRAFLGKSGSCFSKAPNTELHSVAFHNLLRNERIPQ